MRVGWREGAKKELNCPNLCSAIRLQYSKTRKKVKTTQFWVIQIWLKMFGHSALRVYKSAQKSAPFYNPIKMMIMLEKLFYPQEKKA